MSEITLGIVPQLYTIEQAAKLLKTSNSRTEFLSSHVDKPDGLRLTTINGKMRISSIELARYIMTNTK